MARRFLIFVGVVLGLVVTAGCMPKSESSLKTANVSASAIYCIFDPSCTVTVTNSSTTPIPLEAGGTSLLYSRTFVGKPGTPASGLYGYEYRIDLEKASETRVHVEEVGEVTYMPCLRSITIEFGPVIDTLDFDGDKETGDLAYIVTRGGPGKIGIASMQKYSNRVTFHFDSPLCVGGPDHPGDSTYFFGLVSSQPHGSATATLKETAGLGSASPKLKKNRKYNVVVLAPQSGTAGEPDRQESS